MLEAFIKTFGLVKLTLAALLGLTSFAIGSQWTHNLGLAVVCQSFATVGAAYLMNRHKSTAVRSAHDISLIDRLHNERETTLAILTQRLEQQGKIIEQHSKLNSALTIAKHAFAGEREAMQTHLQLRGELLTEAHIPFPKFKGPSFERITKEEDRLRAEIMDLGSDFVENLTAEDHDQLNI